ncbi:MAG TPA: CinA family protein [Actinocrinis sp.]|jgi:nicotinamide-nucleotide amidase|nr:CinA family protein [Actinocrinis sp.]HEV3169963.1 CinA family protein [Actinocrinis sp.]
MTTDGPDFSDAHERDEAPGTEDALDDRDPAELAAELMRRARYGRLTVAVAESLTGGQLAAALTSVPGASSVFRGSVTAYATDLKASILGVDATLLAEHGAVHPEVARQMAEGVRRLCGADVGVATTGVAGPEPQDGRPVGTVYTAVATPDGTSSRRWWFTGSRARIQRSSTAAALNMAVGRLEMWTGS